MACGQMADLLDNLSENGHLLMEMPFCFISLMCELLDFLDVSSLIMPQVLRVLPSFS